MAQQNTSLATRDKKDLQTSITHRINDMVTKGELVFPKNYSPANAVKSAFLILTNVKDKAGKPALEVCTQASISQAILNTVIMGLSPAKKQVYYVVRGTTLCADPSYFGTQAMLNRLKGYDHIECNAQIIWVGDEINYEIKQGKIIITDHIQSTDAIGGDIAGAYCTIVTVKNGITSEDTVIMSMKQIQKSWKRSATGGKSSAHQDQPEEMAKRTVINRACKKYINTSDDSDLEFAADVLNASDPDTTSHPVEEMEVIDGELVVESDEANTEPVAEEKPKQETAAPKQGRPPKQATLAPEPRSDPGF